MYSIVAALLLSSTPWTGPTDNVSVVLINTFGTARIRTCIIYYNPDGSVLDWRWYSDPRQIPKRIGSGLFMANWWDEGMLRTVITRRLKFLRTEHDIELAARDDLPAHRRRKLWQPPKPFPDNEVPAPDRLPGR